MTEPYRETPKTLLRPEQKDALETEEQRLTSMLNAPKEVRSQIDVGHAHRRRQNIRRQLAEESPQPYSQGDADKAVARHKELEEQLRQGMPTQAEMRRNPPGAVGKHMDWEQRNKQAILEYKTIAVRRAVSGHDGFAGNPDAANIEKFRPVGGSGEMNMDGAAIPGKQFFMPDNLAVTNVMDDEDRWAAHLRTAEELEATGDPNDKRIATQIRKRIEREKEE